MRALQSPNGTIQLIDPEYIAQMLTPQHPKAIQNYGLLTWLTTEGAAGGGGGAAAGCCQPQWGCYGEAHVNGGGNVSSADGGRWLV